MKRKVMTLSYPQYRERNDIYLAAGYKLVSTVEKETKVKVTYEIDDKDPHYHELKHYLRNLYSKGPSFYPIIFFALVAFVFLSVYAILLARDRKSFDVLQNVLNYILPAAIFMFVDVLYIVFYYYRNKSIILSHPNSREDIFKEIEKIKNK